MWAIETTTGRIGPGAELVMLPPQVAGQPLDPVTSGVKFSLRFPNGAATGGEIVSASATEAVIKLNDGSHWKITPRGPDELWTGINSPGMRQHQWIVREAALAEGE